MTLDNGAAQATPEGEDHEDQVYHGDDESREHGVPAHQHKDREQWEELPRWQQTSIIALAAVEVVLTTAAIVDLVRRPRVNVRGPKTLWFLGFAVQPFGPLTYLALGRRRP